MKVALEVLPPSVASSQLKHAVTDIGYRMKQLWVGT